MFTTSEPRHKEAHRSLADAGFHVELYDAGKQSALLHDLARRAFAPAHSKHFPPGLHSGRINAGFALLRELAKERLLRQYMPFGVHLLRHQESGRLAATYTIMPGEDVLGIRGSVANYGTIPADQRHVLHLRGYLDNVLVETGDDSSHLITLMFQEIVRQCMESAGLRRQSWELGFHVTKPPFAQAALPSVGFVPSANTVNCRFHGQGRVWARTNGIQLSIF